MQNASQTQPPFWMIGIAVVFVATIALLFLKNATSSPIPPTATPTPVELYLETLPTIITTTVSQTPTPTETSTASPSTPPVLSSKGSGKILFVSDRDGNEEIYVMDVDGRNQTRLTHNVGRDIHPQWSPDGTKIAFLSERENKTGLYHMEIDGSQQTLLTSSVVFGEGEFSWSPDSTQLAYSSLINGSSDISVIHVNPSLEQKEQNLTVTGTQEERSPSWSPDGAEIAFYRDDQYLIINSDGSGERHIMPSSDLQLTQPQWSPDGLYLLLSISDEIFSFHRNTGAVTQLTNNLNYDASPTASPDGTKIAFVSSRSEGSHEIFFMSANGERVEKISNLYDTRASVLNLLWSAASDKIIFTISNYRGGLTAEIFLIDVGTGETSNLSQDPRSSNYLSDVAP